MAKNPLRSDLAKTQQLTKAISQVREVREVLEAEGFPQNAETLKLAEESIARVAHACYSAYGTEVSK